MSQEGQGWAEFQVFKFFSPFLRVCLQVDNKEWSLKWWIWPQNPKTPKPQNPIVAIFGSINLLDLVDFDLVITLNYI